MRLLTWRLSLAIVYMMVIWLLSSVPGRDLARLGLGPELWNLGHLPLFLGLTLVTLWALPGTRTRHVLFAVAACLTYSVVDEWHQQFVPGRVASLMDLRTDAMGVAIGVLLWEGGRSLLQNRRREPQP